jgi:hypothetical protein
MRDQQLTQRDLGMLALGGASGRDLVLEGPGLMRLALMVGTVFDRLTSVDDRPGQAGSSG